MVLLLSAVQGLHAEDGQKESPLRAEKSGLPATWVVLDRPSAKVRARYPYGVTFLKDTDSDTLIGNVDTDIVPIIFKRDKTDVIFPNAPLDSIVSVLNRVIHDPEVNLRYVWIAGSASPEGPEKHK